MALLLQFPQSLNIFLPLAFFCLLSFFTKADENDDSLLAIVYNEKASLERRLEACDIFKHTSFEGLSYTQAFDFYSIKGSILIQLDSLYQGINAFKTTFNLAQKENIEEDQASALNNIGVVFMHMGILDSARCYLQLSLDACLKANLAYDTAIAQLNLGIINYELGNYEIAIKQCIAALRPLEKWKEREMVFSCLSNLGLIHLAVKEYDRALEYHRQSFHEAKSLDKQRQGASALNLGLTHLRKNQSDSAYFYLKLARFVNSNLPSKAQLGDTYVHLAEYHEITQQMDSAFYHFHKALKIRQAIGDKSGVSSVHNHLARIHLTAGQLDSAQNFAQNALLLSKEIGAKREIEKALKTLVKLGLQGQKNGDLAIYLQELEVLQSTLFNDDKLKAISNAEMAFQTEKKEQKIALLQKENELKQTELQKRNQFVFFSFALLGLSIILSVSLVIFFRTKRRLQVEELGRLEADKKALEKEQELSLIQAIIETREEERTRISQELHDGINPALAAAKMNISRLGVGVNIVDDLGRIADDLRRLSHDMAPVAWAHESLEENIAHFLASFDGVNGTSIHLHLPKNGLPEYPLKIQVSLFRITQELTVNVMKHAHASKASFNFTLENDYLLIVVSDNGIGIQSDEIDKGLGLRSIRERVNLLKGKMDISHNQGIGTTSTLKIPLP